MLIEINTGTKAWRELEKNMETHAISILIFLRCLLTIMSTIELTRKTFKTSPVSINIYFRDKKQLLYKRTN